MSRVLWIAIIICVACTPLVPATTPPQLAHTPGIFVNITSEYIITPDFSLAIPDGWRVVKSSIASAPLEFVLVSPDETMTIQVSETPLDDAQIATADDVTLYILGESEAEFADKLAQWVMSVIDSVQVSDA